MVVNKVNLEIINRIPLDGVDTHILCNGCSAACCRQGVSMPLSGDEVQFMIDQGTTLEKADVTKRSLGRRILDRLVKSLPDGHQMMTLTSDCANLEVNPETGRLDCNAYYDERRPKICSEFKMGGYACGLIQLDRLSGGKS